MAGGTGACPQAGDLSARANQTSVYTEGQRQTQAAGDLERAGSGLHDGGNAGAATDLSSVSRLARRSLALRPAHSRGHQFVTRYPKASDISSPPCLLRLLPAGANRGVGLAPTEKRRLVTAHPHSRLSRHSDPMR